MESTSDIKLVNNAINKIRGQLKEEQMLIERANIEEIRKFYKDNPHMENADGELAILHDQYIHTLGSIFSQWAGEVFVKNSELIPIGVALMQFFTNEDENGPHLIDAYEDEDVNAIVTYGVLKANSSILAVAWKNDEIILHTAGYTENVKFTAGNDIFVDDFRTALGDNWGTALAPILRPWLIKGTDEDIDLPDEDYDELVALISDYDEESENTLLEKIPPELQSEADAVMENGIKALEEAGMWGNPVQNAAEGEIRNDIASIADQVCDYNAEVGCDLCVYRMTDGRCWKNHWR